MKPSIAVIMTVYNRKEITIECLRRFYENSALENYEVEFYMLDDGSIDGTSEAVAALFPQIEILHGDGNLFWNRGMYYCWKESLKRHHDFYLWLNDDTYIFNNCLEKLFDLYKNQTSPVVIVGAISSSDGKTATYGGRNDDGIIPPTGQPQIINRFCGNVVLIPNQVVDIVGINDPYFRHSRGDSEYGLRLGKNGIEILLTADYVGTCDRHDNTMKCFDKSVNLLKRYKFLYSPFGFNPSEIYHLYKPYKGFFYAIKMVLFYHLKTFIGK